MKYEIWFSSLLQGLVGNGNDEENYKALKTLHAELDDDHDGQVNKDESNDVSV